MYDQTPSKQNETPPPPPNLVAAERVIELSRKLLRLFHGGDRIPAGPNSMPIELCVELMRVSFEIVWSHRDHIDPDHIFTRDDHILMYECEKYLPEGVMSKKRRRRRAT